MGCWLLLLALFFSLSYRKKYSFCTVCVCKIRETINEQYHKLLMLNYLCHDNTQNVQYTQASDIWPLATGFHSYDGWLAYSLFHSALTFTWSFSIGSAYTQRWECTMCVRAGKHIVIFINFQTFSQTMRNYNFRYMQFFRCLHIEVNRFSIMALLLSTRCVSNYCKIQTSDFLFGWHFIVTVRPKKIHTEGPINWVFGDLFVSRHHYSLIEIVRKFGVCLVNH